MSHKTYNTSPKKHLLLSLVNADLPQKVLSALNEFVDNSLGEGSGNANKVEIHYKKDKLVILDDGQGVSNIGALFTIGDSQNRLHASDIGSFGYGSKVGALYLGWGVEVHTIHGGKYERMSVNWKEVMESKGDAWPRLKSDILPAYEAPHIMNGKGTMIIISDRHEKRIWQSSSIADRMAHTYKPALDAGKEIKLFHYTPKGNKAKVINLSDRVNIIGLSNIIEFEGEVDGKKFKCRAGIKANPNNVLNAVHVAYGHRFIKSYSSLPKTALPPNFYAEVFLDKAWKKSLTATKNDIANGRQELLEAVKEGTAELIDELKEAMNDIKIDMLNTSISSALDEAIVAASKELEGEHGLGEEIEVFPNGDGGGNPGPDEPKVKRYKPKGKGRYGVENVKPKNHGLEIKYTSGLGEMAYKVSQIDNTVILSLNKDVPYIFDAYNNTPANIVAIWGVAATAISEYIFQSPEERACIVAGLRRDLIASGGSDNEGLKQQLYYSLLKNYPGIKEPTEAEVKKKAPKAKTSEEQEG